MEASEKKVSTRVRGAAWRRKDAPKARGVSFPGRHERVEEKRDRGEKRRTRGNTSRRRGIEVYLRKCLQGHEEKTRYDGKLWEA